MNRISDIVKNKSWISGHNPTDGKKVSISLKLAWKKGKFKNRKIIYTPEMKKHQSLIHLKYYKNKKNIKKLSDGMKKLYKNKTYKKYWYEQNQKMLTRKFNSKTSMNKNESRVSNILKKMKIKHRFNFRLSNKFYDFYLKDYKVLVEADGKFWHNMSSHIANDKIKNEIAKNNGYKLIRVDDEMSDTVIINKILGGI